MSRAAVMPRVVPALLAGMAALSLNCGSSSSESGDRSGTEARPAEGPAGPRLFAPTSVWNVRQKRTGQRLDPSSRERVGALAKLIAEQMRRPPEQGGGYPNLGADTYSTPIYRVGRGTRRVPVQVHTDESGKGFVAVAAAGVPIPRGAAPAAGTDGHMTVYQRSTDTLWEFWRARHLPDGWHASWGGAMRNVSRSPGYYSPRAWPGLPPGEGWNWGSTATGLPVAGGTVTTDELRRGRIDHALAMNVPMPCRGVFSWPAQDSDGTSADPNCMPEGARLRLDPALDVGPLKLHPVAKALAHAAQEYGIVVRDRTRVSAQFFLESPPPGKPSPYTGPDGLFQGVAPYQVLEGFPWSRLQLLPLSLCRAAPCRRRD